MALCCANAMHDWGRYYTSQVNVHDFKFDIFWSHSAQATLSHRAIVVMPGAEILSIDTCVVDCYAKYIQIWRWPKGHPFGSGEAAQKFGPLYDQLLAGSVSATGLWSQTDAPEHQKHHLSPPDAHRHDGTHESPDMPWMRGRGVRPIHSYGWVNYVQ